VREVEDELAVEGRRLELVAGEAAKNEVVRLEVDLERLWVMVAGGRHGGEGGEG